MNLADNTQKNQDEAKFSWDVFISYVSPDRPKADELYQRIPDRFRCFLDHKCLTPGENWTTGLADALGSSRVTAILVSAATQGSHYQAEECARAITQARDSGNQRKVVPIYLEGIPGRTDWNLFGLNVLQGIGVPESGGLEGAVNRLVEVLDTHQIERIPIRSEHVLHQFPRRMVEAYEIDENIIAAYARAFTAVRAELFVAKANAFRRDADPDATIIETMELSPIDNAAPLVWWNSVFRQARLHGARMIAALLLTATRIEFPENVEFLREKLLNSLRSSTLQSSTD